MAKIRLAGIVRESIVDGPGIRFVVFTQGCKHNCKGCHNPETHDLNGGYETDTEKILDEIKKNPLLKGVTFSGGDPFLQAYPLSLLAKEVHRLNLDVVVYTGYTYEQLLAGSNEHPDWEDLLKETDILIDGPFILEKRDLRLQFRGSSNQRIICIKKSR